MLREKSLNDFQVEVQIRFCDRNRQTENDSGWGGGGGRGGGGWNAYTYYIPCIYLLLFYSELRGGLFQKRYMIFAGTTFL